MNYGPADRLSVNILGVFVDRIDFAGLLERIDLVGCPASRAPCHPAVPAGLTVNPEFIVDARANADFAAVLRRADLRVPDGVGVLWAANQLGAPLHERVTGSDGIYRIAERAASRRAGAVFFLGAAPGVALRTAGRLRELYPRLEVVGAYDGSPQMPGGQRSPPGCVAHSPTSCLSPMATPSRTFGSTAIAPSCRWP